MKVIIACDSFKGSLDSAAVNEACRLGVEDALPDSSVDSIELADGGEGTVDAIASVVGGGIRHTVIVENPIGEEIEAYYYGLPDGKTAIIETASAAGLTLIPACRRNPLYTGTYGLGQLIADAVSKGYRSIVVGLGGSATNDGGTGMLQALGYRLQDESGGIINHRGGIILSKIVAIDSSCRIAGLENVEFTALCDVANPLLGCEGATYIYGPQKGADASMLEVLEKGMANYARLLPDGIANSRGAGAAGGLGAAMLGFLKAKLKPGIDAILDIVDFDRMLIDVDLVITGEGRLDRSTMMGKAVSGILRRAQSRGVPVIAIGGSVDRSLDLSGFRAAYSVTPPGMSLETAMRPEIASRNIRTTISRIIKNSLSL